MYYSPAKYLRALIPDYNPVSSVEKGKGSYFTFSFCEIEWKVL